MQRIDYYIDTKDAESAGSAPKSQQRFDNQRIIVGALNVSQIVATSF